MKFWNKIDSIKKKMCIALSDIKKKISITISEKKICMVIDKKKICLAAGLLLIPLSLLLHPGAAMQKLMKPNKKEQQLAPSVQGAGEPGPTGKEVSRGGQVDRGSVYLLAQVIEGEAANEPYEGKVAVGAVIINRTQSPKFQHTIPGVIYDTDAFESVSNGQYQRPLSGDSLNAAVDAMNGNDPTGGALYFWNPAKAKSPWVWSRPIITQIGEHVFAR